MIAWWCMLFTGTTASPRMPPRRLPGFTVMSCARCVRLGFSGVIDASVGRPVGWATVAAGLSVTLMCASLAIGRLRYEAPLLIACCGLAALAARGGPIGPVLRTAGRPQVYLAMALETVVLLILVSLAGGALIFFRKIRWVVAGSNGAIRPYQAVLAALRSQRPDASPAAHGAVMKRIFDSKCPACFRRLNSRITRAT